MNQKVGIRNCIAKTLALSLVLAFAWHALANAKKGEKPDSSTDATEPASDPAIIANLKFIGEESLTWLIRPGFPDGERNTLRYIDTLNRRNNITVNLGDIFFAEEPAAGRFKFLGHVTLGVIDERIGAHETRTFARIEDQRHNKLGMIYEIPAPLSAAVVNQFEQKDRTAIFTLVNVDGLDGEEFNVEEFTTFTLPPGSKGPAFRLVSVNENEVVVQFTDADGENHAVTIPKGGIPEL